MPLETNQIVRLAGNLRDALMELRDASTDLDDAYRVWASAQLRRNKAREVLTAAAEAYGAVIAEADGSWAREHAYRQQHHAGATQLPDPAAVPETLRGIRIRADAQEVAAGSPAAVE